MHAYETIAATLRGEILDGTWPPGSMLPTIPDLMGRFRVSRMTVREALRQLHTESLVRTGYVAGKRGTIVRARDVWTYRATDALRPGRPADGTADSFVEAATHAGKAPAKDLHVEVVRPPTEVAVRLGVTGETWVVRRTVRQLVDDEPWSQETTWFELDFARETGVDVAEDVRQGTLRRLREAGYAEVAWVDEVLAVHAGPVEAELLGVPVGAGLLAHLRTGGTAERVTRVTRWVRVADRSRLTWELGEEDGLAVIRAARSSS